MENCCAIFSASEIFDYSNISCKNSFIIVADGGIRHTDRLGITPDIVIGDMDSVDKALIPEGAILFPTQKDDTDTLLAIKKCLELGYKDFTIYGGLGGRLDHTVSNIQSLAFLIENGAKGILKDEKHTVLMIKNEEIKITDNYDYISVFAYGTDAYGVTLKGVSYPLDNYALKTSFPLGVSNQKNGEVATIKVENGTLLIILINE